MLRSIFVFALVFSMLFSVSCRTQAYVQVKNDIITIPEITKEEAIVRVLSKSPMVRIDRDIDMDLAGDVITELYNANKNFQDAKYVGVYINSNGGEIMSGKNIMEALKDSRLTPICIVDKKAYSMAAIILVHCPIRVAVSDSGVLFHLASFNTPFGAVSIMPDSTDLFDQSIIELYHSTANAIGMDYDTFSKKMTDTWLVLSYNLLKNNIVDVVVDRKDLTFGYVPTTNETMFKYDFNKFRIDLIFTDRQFNEVNF